MNINKNYILSIFIILCLVITIGCITPSRTTTINADFYVSNVLRKICEKQQCNISISENEISLNSDQYSITINEFQFVAYHNAYGKDIQGKEWNVIVGNLKSEPYFMLLRSSDTIIVVGTECYKQ